MSPEQLAVATNALAAGQQAFAKGEYPAAEQQFRIALAAAPSAAAQNGIASSLDLQAKPTEAFDAYTELLARPDLDQLAPADALTRASAPTYWHKFPPSFAWRWCPRISWFPEPKCYWTTRNRPASKCV